MGWKMYQNKFARLPNDAQNILIASLKRAQKLTNYETSAEIRSRILARGHSASLPIPGTTNAASTTFVGLQSTRSASSAWSPPKIYRAYSPYGREFLVAGTHSGSRPGLHHQLRRQPNDRRDYGAIFVGQRKQ